MIVFVLIAASAIWYFLPTFFERVEPSDVKSIAVFNGNTGKDFDISDADEIRYIVENTQGIRMEKGV